MQLITFIAVATATISPAFAFCCSSKKSGFNRYCDDGSVGTPCCATGKCNVFCCACSGQCREPSWRRALLSTADTTPAADVGAAFKAADTDHNGAISLQEYLTYMAVDGAPDIWANYYKKFDTNGDGTITESELSGL